MVIKGKIMTVEKIIDGLKAQEIDEAVDFLTHLDKNHIPKDDYGDLAKSIGMILSLNSFDENIKFKLDELVSFLTSEM